MAKLRNARRKILTNRVCSPRKSPPPFLTPGDSFCRSCKRVSEEVITHSAEETTRWGREFAKRLQAPVLVLDRKSTRLNSSHQIISYAVFCLKKKIARQRGTKPN